MQRNFGCTGGAIAAGKVTLRHNDATLAQARIAWKNVKNFQFPGAQ